MLSVPARIVTEPWPAVSARMRDEKLMYDILFLWHGPRYVDPNNWLGEMYDCDLLGSGNSSWYCNKDVDRLIKEARATVEPKARIATFEKAAIKIAEDAGGIFVATGRADIAHARRIKGVRYAPVGETFELRFFSFE
jgi:peptide/nickel transport system substrate-binding protein